MRTIQVKSYGNVIEELTPAAAFYPGHLLEMDSDGKVKKHATAGGNVLVPFVATENFLEGKGIDDAYAVGDKAQVWIPQRGDIALFVLADGQDVVIGDPLESDGYGRLQKHTADSADLFSEAIVGIAAEAKDLSDSEGAEESEEPFGYNKRIQVRIL